MNSLTLVRRFLLALALLDLIGGLSATAQPISLVQKPLWPGFRRGGAGGVAVSNNYAFVGANDGGLMVLDVSNPSRPRFVSQTPEIGWAHRVKLSGNLAYVATLAQIEIVDISDPVHPTPIGGMNFGGRSIDVDVVGTTAYVADEYNGLRIYDVSLPWLPILLGTTTNGFYATGVKVVGNYAYIAATQNGLKIVDVSNPAHPVLVGASSTLTAIPYDVHVRGNYVFLSDLGYGLHVFNATNPAAPVRVGGVHRPNAVGMDVAGDTLFLANRIEGLQLINISNPAVPFPITMFNTPGDALDVFVKDGLAYVADDDTGLQIINVITPAAPTRVGEFITGGLSFEVQVVGTNAVLAETFLGVRVLNVNNPTNVIAGGWVPVFGAIALQAVSNRIYAACQGDGLHIIDISNPNVPVRLGATNTVNAALDVCVISNLCYVADSMAGLQIYNISNPNAIARVGGVLYTNDNVNATGLQVIGRYAYVSYAASGLQIFDVQNPANPVRVGGWKNGGIALAVFVEGDYAYLANGYSGLDIIDVSDPAQPQLVANFPVVGAAFDIQVVNRRAYVAAEYGGITVVDVRNPRHPRFATRQISGTGYGVAVAGDYVYLASGNEGLKIFRQVTPPRLETQIRPGGMAVSWKLDDDLGPLSLESASSPNAPDWQSLGTNNPTLVPTGNANQYFRLRFDQ